MPWHDVSPWERRRRKGVALTGPEALAEIERKVRLGDVGLMDALRIAYTVGLNSQQERRKAKK